jgi:hypothetical protein
MKLGSIAKRRVKGGWVSLRSTHPTGHALPASPQTGGNPLRTEPGRALLSCLETFSNRGTR